MNRILSTLSLCRRASKLVCGFDLVKQAVINQKVYIVLLASDLSPKTKKEVEFVCNSRQIGVLTLPATIDEIWYSVGKRAGVLAVTERGLAEKLNELIDRLDKEECTI